MSKTWLDFYAVCPASGCKDDTPGYWYHNNCGGKIIINKYADMQDDRSGCSSCHKIWDWRFNCGRHSEYKRPDYFKMMNIYTELSTIPELRTKDYKEFRRTLRDSLEDMPADDE